MSLQNTQVIISKGAPLLGRGHLFISNSYSPLFRLHIGVGKELQDVANLNKGELLEPHPRALPFRQFSAAPQREA